jgi:hypothetical protein
MLSEAALIRKMGVTIFAIGIRESDPWDFLQQAFQLKSVASAPTNEHVFIISSIDYIPGLVDAISASTCNAPALVQCCASSGGLNSYVWKDNFKYFLPSCAANTASLIIKVTQVTGSV